MKVQFPLDKNNHNRTQVPTIYLKDTILKNSLPNRQELECNHFSYKNVQISEIKQSRSKMSIKQPVKNSLPLQDISKNKAKSENRTNSMSSSNSKSRVSANLSAIQMIFGPQHDDNQNNSQTALKLKKILEDPNALGSTIQLKQNLSTASQSIFNQKLQNYQTHKSSQSAQLPSKKNESVEKQNPQISKGSHAGSVISIKSKNDKSIDEISQKLNSLQVHFSNQQQDEQQIGQLDSQIKTLKSEQMKKLTLMKASSQFEPIKSRFEKLLSIQYQNCKNQFASAFKNNSSIGLNLLEYLENLGLILFYDFQSRSNEMRVQMEIFKKEKGKMEEKLKKIEDDKGFIEQERNALIEAIKKLQDQLEEMKQQSQSNKGSSNINIDQLTTEQLKELSQLMKQKIQEMSEKESKLIKLVLAIKKSGVDIEKIYNEEVLNDESEMNQSIKSQKIIITQSSNYNAMNDADNSIVNDSDESSFQFQGRLDNESIIESIRRFEMKNIINEGLQNRFQSNKVQFKLDLSDIKQNQQKLGKPQIANQQYPPKMLKMQVQQSNPTTNPSNHSDGSNLSSILLLPNDEIIKQQQNQKQNKMKLDFQFKNGQEPLGFHQEFMMKINQFSESWRQQALKEDRGKV